MDIMRALPTRIVINLLKIPSFSAKLTRTGIIACFVRNGGVAITTTISLSFRIDAVINFFKVLPAYIEIFLFPH